MSGSRKYLAAFLLMAIASAWNLTIVGSVALNQDWVKKWAAGGQFDIFPTWLRAVYLVIAAFMILQCWFAYKLMKHQGAWSRLTRRLTTLLMISSLISAVVNAISRSSHERVNTLFALAMAWGYMIFRSSKKVDQ